MKYLEALALFWLGIVAVGLVALLVMTAVHFPVVMLIFCGVITTSGAMMLLGYIGYKGYAPRREEE